MAEFVESIRWEGDISDLQDKMRRIERGHDDVKNTTDKSTSRMRDAWKGVTGSIGKTIGTIAKVGGAVAVAGIGAAAAFGPKILEQGAALDALGKKAATVFEGSLGGVEAWAADSAKAMGLTRTELVGLAADTADLLKPMGFTADAAADMSKKTQELSGALSAWTGGTVSSADASKILTKAYLGERDALTSLGIKISEADVQARLASKGQDELTGAALEQAKAVATQELIFEKSTDAQKAWADGSMSAVQSQNAMKASVGELEENLVRALFPALQAIMPHLSNMAEWMGDRLPGAIATVRAWFDENWPAIQAVIANVVDWFKNDALPVIEAVLRFVIAAAGDAVTWFRENWPQIREVIGEVIDWFQTHVQPVVEAVIAFVVATFEELVGWVRENWPDIKNTIDGVMGAVMVIIDTVTAIITEIWERWGSEILAYLSNTWETIKAVVEAAIKIVRGVIDTVTALIRGDWSEVWEGIKTILSGIWDAIEAIVSGALEAIKILASTAWGAMKARIEEVWNGVRDWFGGVWDAIKGFVTDGVSEMISALAGLPTGIKNAVAGAFDSIWDGFKSVVNRVIDAWNSLELPGFTVGGWNPPGPGPSFPSITIPSIGVPNIPRLAAGGLAFGPMLAVIGDNANARNDPEIVSPESRMAATFQGVLERFGNGRPGEYTLIIEGEPIKARIAEYDAEQRATIMAGVR